MNKEKEKKKIHMGTILMMIIAIIMIVISIQRNVLPPGLTGIGFLILIWMHREKDELNSSLNKDLRELQNEQK